MRGFLQRQDDFVHSRDERLQRLLTQDHARHEPDINDVSNILASLATEGNVFERLSTLPAREPPPVAIA